MSTAAQRVAPDIATPQRALRDATKPAPQPWLKRFFRAFTNGAVTVSVSDGKNEQGYFRAQWPALAIIAVLLVSWWNTYSNAREREVTAAAQTATISEQIRGLKDILNVRDEQIKELNKKVEINAEEAKVTQDLIQQYRIELARDGRKQ